jgi:hypothetical protein
MKKWGKIGENTIKMKLPKAALGGECYKASHLWRMEWQGIIFDPR